MNSLLAIDPGCSGGIAIRHGDIVSAYAMPATPKDVCDIIAKAQAEAYGAAFDGSGRMVAASAPAEGSIKCYIEQVSGYAGGPGQPGSAMFNFGRGFGNIEGFLIALEIPFVMVVPGVWQRTLNLGTRHLERVNLTPGMTPKARKAEKQRISQTNSRLKRFWKNKLKEVAQRFYPRIKVTLAVADALLLLEYARRMENACGANIPKVYVEPTEARLKINPLAYIMEQQQAASQLDLTGTDGCKVTLPTVPADGGAQ